MSIHWDAENKRWRFMFRRVVGGARHRSTRLLPKGWSRAQADAFDLKETARLFEVASGGGNRDPLIDEAVVLYLDDKKHLKSYQAAREHLAALTWAYEGRRMSELAAVAADASRRAETSASTVRNRLALLKAACRWAWKKHKLTPTDPTTHMQMPAVRNERHRYLSRLEMLTACRACSNWQAQVAIRLAFYSGLRLGELLEAQGGDGRIVLEDTKNGDRRVIPAHPKVRHLLRFLPLPGPKISIQRAWERARDSVGLEDAHFHDLRHSAASEMVNAGVDLYTVGKVLGHRDSRSTQRYAHLRHDTLAAAVATIGKRRG